MWDYEHCESGRIAGHSEVESLFVVTGRSTFPGRRSLETRIGDLVTTENEPPTSGSPTNGKFRRRAGGVKVRPTA